MGHLDEIWIKPYGLYVWVHKSILRLKICEPKMYVMKKCGTRRVKYECEIRLKAKCIGIWQNEHSYKGVSNYEKQICII